MWHILIAAFQAGLYIFFKLSLLLMRLYMVVNFVIKISLWPVKRLIAPITRRLSS